MVGRCSEPLLSTHRNVAYAAGGIDRPAPVTLSLALSAPTCSIAGRPPFTITTTYTSTSTVPIWALIPLHTEISGATGGLNIRGRACVSGRYKDRIRRIGPVSSRICDEGPDHFPEDTALVRFAPAESYDTTYTLSLEPKASGLRHSDMYYMLPDEEYTVGFKPRDMWWLEENNLRDGYGALNLGCAEEIREVLSRTVHDVFLEECRASFKAYWNGDWNDLFLILGYEDLIEDEDSCDEVIDTLAEA